MFQPHLLAGRSAIITGGSRGIGLATARALAAAGATRLTLVARDTNGTELDAAARLIREGAPGVETVVKRGPVTADSFLRGVVLEAKADILVNAAGTAQRSLLLRTTAEAVRNVLETNLAATTLACQAFAREALGRSRGRKAGAAGGGDGAEARRDACIVNVGSLLGSKGGVGASVYAASKAGVLGLTRALAAELGPVGIRVNAVVPGYVDTDMVADMTAQQREIALTAIPQRRFGTPEEIAAAVVFLAASPYANNCVLNLDGGLSAT